MKDAIEALGKFHDIEEVPGGANSYAFRARHQQLGRTCFLKLIDFPPEGEETILREPRALVSALEGAVRCENIVRLYDAEVVVHETDRYVLLQMEWLDGQSLQRQLDQGCVGQQDAVRITMGILRGVAHLHENRLVHRDLKPANILLTHAASPSARIADFGSVAQVQHGHTAVPASKHSDLYVPWEGWTHPPQYSFQSDVYQVGLVLYQLACGPFPTDGAYYVTRAVRRELKQAGQTYEALDGFGKCAAERRSFAELTHRDRLIEYTKVSQPYLSSSLRRIISRATKADRSERVTSATEFLNLLSRVTVPNWCPHNDHFVAREWRGWNWMVRRGAADCIEVCRARAGTDNFRRYSSHRAFEQAFLSVERFAG